VRKSGREDGRSPVEQEDDAGEICHIRWDFRLRPKPPNPLRTSKRPYFAVDKSSGLLGNVGGAAIDDQENRALGAGHQALEKLDEDRCI
jgi:hypothetical protein